jgi:hypothetical protein
VSEWTPGPWSDMAGTTSGRVVVAHGQPKVRFSVASCGGQNRDANARLIAAAPALAEALDEMVAQFGDLPEWYDNRLHAAVRQARIALSLAHGDTNGGEA